MKPPRLDLPLKQLVQFRTSPLRRLRDQKPDPNDKRQAHPSVEPARLEPPVPLVRVDHVRREHVHDHARDAGRSRREAGRVGAEALGGDLAYETPACCACALHADAWEELISEWENEGRERGKRRRKGTRGTRTPAASEEDEEVVCRVDLGRDAEDADAHARRPDDGAACAGHVAPAQLVDGGDEEDVGDDADGGGDASDEERVFETGLLEEVGREGGEELEAGELLGHEGPEGDEGAEAVDAFEDGVPLLGPLGGGKVGFVLDSDG